jgi:GT2 family glycosyltransferase
MKDSAGLQEPANGTTDAASGQAGRAAEAWPRSAALLSRCAMQDLTAPEPAGEAGVADLAVVLVYWNDETYIGPCLESLFGGGLRCRFDVLVVDNGSTEDRRAALHATFPRLRTMRNDVNVGLARACNQAIRATRSRHVLLLNNDTLVSGPSLDAMVDHLDAHPRVAAVGGRLLNADGSVQSCHNRFSTLREEFLIATRLGELLWAGYPSVTDDDQIRSVDWLSSACLLLRRAALDEVGLLDESYFIYGVEVDLQYRLKRAGWDIRYLPHASTVHFGGRSMQRWSRRKLVYRGKMLFYRKNRGPAQTAALRAMLGGLSSLKLVAWSVPWLAPAWRDRAVKELRSNLDVIRLCLALK